MAKIGLVLWDLWYPQAAATGISFARSRIDPVDTVLVHAAPQVLSVEVRDDQGRRKAGGIDLARTLDSPITRLTCQSNQIRREDIWPGAEEIGMVVILPGGEAGILKEWWNAADHSEWRWRMEFYNKRDKK